jgi:hypothetical protein
MIYDREVGGSNPLTLTTEAILACPRPLHSHPKLGTAGPWYMGTRVNFDSANKRTFLLNPAKNRDFLKTLLRDYDI